MSDEELVRQAQNGDGQVSVALVKRCEIVIFRLAFTILHDRKKGKGEAISLHCNLTQIGHTFRMYRDDWDGVEPQKGAQLEYWEVGLPPKEKHVHALHPYLKSEDVWRCPSRFLLPHIPERVSNDVPTYIPNYCSHIDAKLDPSLQYDECWLSPGTRKGPIASFRRMISVHPDLPILYCEAHRYFYFPRSEWVGGRFLFGIILIDFSVRRFNWMDYEPLP